MNANLLIVDDEPTIAATLKRFFEAKGYRAATARDAKSALALAKAERFDLVLLDNVLPGASGLEVLSELKRLTGAPVVMTTGAHDERLREELMLLGAAELCAKPFDFKTLERTVARLIGETRKS